MLIFRSTSSDDVRAWPINEPKRTSRFMVLVTATTAIVLAVLFHFHS